MSKSAWPDGEEIGEELVGHADCDDGGAEVLRYGSYAASGGGCNYSTQGWMGVCISENGAQYVVADLYINGPVNYCDQARLGLVDLTTNTEVNAIAFPCDGATGFVASVDWPATPGHRYEAEAIITYPYDDGFSPIQIA